MHNLHQLVQSGFTDHVIIQCTATDLQNFARAIITETRQAVQEQYEQKYYTMEDICRMLGIKRNTVYGYVRKGILQPVKVGRALLFDRVEFRETVDRLNIGKNKQYV